MKRAYLFGVWYLVFMGCMPKDVPVGKEFNEGVTTFVVVNNDVRYQAKNSIAALTSFFKFNFEAGSTSM